MECVAAVDVGEDGGGDRGAGGTGGLDGAPGICGGGRGGGNSGAVLVVVAGGGGGPVFVVVVGVPETGLKGVFRIFATNGLAGVLGAGTLGAGTLGAGTLGAGTLGAGTLGAGTLGAGTLGAGTLGAGTLGAGTLGGSGGGVLVEIGGGGGGGKAGDEGFLGITGGCGGCCGLVTGGFGIAGRLVVGMLGAETVGGFGFDPSDSDRYGEFLLAPVSTPPRLRSFGIPAAKSPPS